MPLSVFYSYAHADRKFKDELLRHLSLLQREGLVDNWHDGRILAGEDWSNEIKSALEASPIVVLLVSAHFLASNFCYDVEMAAALARHENGEATVIPVILQPCDWHHSPIGALQALPTDGKPITKWRNRQEAYLVVTQGLREVIEAKEPQPAATGPWWREVLDAVRSRSR